MTEFGLMFTVFDPNHEIEKLATVNIPGAIRSPETFHVLVPDVVPLFSASQYILKVVQAATIPSFFSPQEISKVAHQVIFPSFTTSPLIARFC